MRIKITFQLSGKKQVLPLNYQYPISAWIYKVFAQADKEFASKLHEAGYKLENGKTFKLFTFSQLKFPKHTWKIIPKSDRIEIWSRKVFLTIAFQLPEQMENFVMGLFQNQKASIGDKISQIDMKVETIEVLKNEIPNTATVKIKPLSPITLGLFEENKKYETYILPTHPKYKELFLKNLIDKYEASGKNRLYLDDLDFNVVKLYTKTSMQKIKANTKAETKVRAYWFDFELTAPKELIELGLNAGFGSMNSMGFGMCELVRQD
ncbi:MAG: CRISPR-associated endoribonuclease Cas6 [Bacteroidota bacterium]|nr:CRISPR-associated endoribonuclease Cas6 [Bacteroidota bacterium]